MNSGTGVIHIIHRVPAADWDLPDTKVRALCGAEAVVGEDAEVTPPNFDFVFAENPNRLAVATCEACKEKAR